MNSVKWWDAWLFLILAFSSTTVWAQSSPIDSYIPCSKAVQHLKVPEDINLADPGQQMLPPAHLGEHQSPLPNQQELFDRETALSLLFSQDGVDVYAVRSGPPSLAGRWQPLVNRWENERYGWTALLIFQDDAHRRDELHFWISTGSVAWEYFQTSLGRQDWKPIADFKYERIQFGWQGPRPVLLTVEFYAPRECDSHMTFPDTIPSSHLGNYGDVSGTAIGPDSVAYKAAIALKKAQTDERQREREEFERSQKK